MPQICRKYIQRRKKKFCQFVLFAISYMLLNSRAVMINCIFNRLHQSRIRIRVVIRLIAVMVVSVVGIRAINRVAIMKNVAMVEGASTVVLRLMLMLRLRLMLLVLVLWRVVMMLMVSVRVLVVVEHDVYIAVRSSRRCRMFARRLVLAI